MDMSKVFSQIKAYATRRNLPIIPVRASDISIVTEPRTFYQILLDNIDSAKRRVALSALYIGTGHKEAILIQKIIDNLRRNNKLAVNIVLDANRARRTDERSVSSVTALEPLLAFDTVQLGLIDTCKNDSFIHKILSRFQKLNEIISTYHSKFLVFDDNLIVTGANLSSIYFEERQDRYLILRKPKLLSDYMYELLDNLNGIDTSFTRLVRDHNSKYTELLDKQSSTEQKDCFIIPLIQHGPSGLNDNDEFIRFLDSILPESARVYMSSGYFNPNFTMQSIKLSSVLAPCEEANGFFNGGGFLKYVPRLYTAIHKQYIDSHQSCKMFLYQKPGWSFHAKGIWIEDLDDLYIHLMGSSNFNCRSSDRDFEVQLVLLTRNRNLIEKLKAEREGLWEQSQQLDRTNIQGLNFVYNLIAKVVRTFL